MGYGYDKESYKEAQDAAKNKYRNVDTKAILKRLKSHPNFKELYPVAGENQIEYTLRVVSHIISPPMEDGEDTTIECVDLASAILSMNNEIKENWEKFNKP